MIETLRGGRRVERGHRVARLSKSSEAVLAISPAHRAAPITRHGHVQPQLHSADRPHFSSLQATRRKFAQPGSRLSLAGHHHEPLGDSSEPLAQTPAQNVRKCPDPQFLGLDSSAVQAYSQLMDRLSLQLDLSEPRALCLTSATLDDAKTCAALNLGLVAAMASERRVLVIDANLTRPQATERLGIHSPLGLSDVLAEGVHPTEAICGVAPAGFDLLPAGQANPRAIELLSSRRMNVLVRELKYAYDLVIVDAPHVAEQSIRQFHAGFDGVFLVLQIRRTRRKAIDRALALLQDDGVTVHGCILAYTGPAKHGCVRTLDMPEAQEAVANVAEVPLIDPASDAQGVSIAVSDPDALPWDAAEQQANASDQTNLDWLPSCTVQTDNVPHEPPVATWRVDESTNQMCDESLDCAGASNELVQHSCASVAGETLAPQQPAEADSDSDTGYAFIPLDGLQSQGAPQECLTNNTDGASDDSFDKVAEEEGAGNNRGSDEQCLLGDAADFDSDQSENAAMQPKTTCDWSAGSPDATSGVEPPEENCKALNLLESAQEVPSCGEPPTESCELDAETLRRLETLRPFDNAYLVPDSDESVEAAPNDDEFDAQPMAGDGDVAITGNDDVAETSTDNISNAVCRDDVSSTRMASGSIRIPRLGRRLLESRVPNGDEAVAAGTTTDPWAADVLAFSGLILFGASIFYIAADVLLWF
jgi:Mrp family chromosome partitioning ATPase